MSIIFKASKPLFVFFQILLSFINNFLISIGFDKRIPFLQAENVEFDVHKHFKIDFAETAEQTN